MLSAEKYCSHISYLLQHLDLSREHFQVLVCSSSCPVGGNPPWGLSLEQAQSFPERWSKPRVSLRLRLNDFPGEFPEISAQSRFPELCPQAAHSGKDRRYLQQNITLLGGRFSLQNSQRQARVLRNKWYLPLVFWRGVSRWSLTVKKWCWMLEPCKTQITPC